MLSFMAPKIENPIIQGFFPDPSMIRVRDDFYVVNSSFEYFPAIPIFHSRDLVHWRQIGNVVTCADQGLDLSDVRPSGGVQAATIRHHDGVFYVTSTRVKSEWPRLDYHFIVTATDINGPWSKCHFIENAEGIDSSLFFDDDGKTYFLANRQRENATSGNDTEIWMSEINLTTFQLVGEKISLWAGTGGIYPEGPRLFKRHGWYYLLIAEGGTLHHHTTTMARSRNVHGPYESCARNPIMTHRYLPREHPIHNVGHADMVELQDGSWWGVALASRPRGGFYDGGNTIYTFGGYYRNLGRETFLFPISWPDDESPVFSPDTGKIEFEYPAPSLPLSEQTDVPYDFSAESLAIKWVRIRNALVNASVVDSGGLSLTLSDSLEDSFYGVRQNSWKFRMCFDVDVSALKAGDVFMCGAYIKEGHYLAMEFRTSDVVEISIGSATESQPRYDLTSADTAFRVEITGDDQDYCFTLLGREFAHTLDGREISCDMTDSHTGVMLGFWGVSESNSPVMLSNFTYEKL